MAAAGGERDEATEQAVRAEVLALCRAFPIYPGLDDTQAVAEAGTPG